MSRCGGRRRSPFGEGSMRVGRARRWRAVTLLTVLALVAVACGGDDDESSGGSASEATEEADSNGVLRITTSLLPTSVMVQWDPSRIQTPATPAHLAVYGTLLREQVDGSFEPDLASAAEVVDPRT